jgi:hypothetical protein
LIAAMRHKPICLSFLAIPALLAGCVAAVPINSAYPLLSAASATPAQVGSYGPRLLRAHNAERAAVGVTLLAWDEQLAASASTYAAQLAQLGTLRHSDRATRGGAGENLWMGTRGYFTPEQMVDNWASEKRMFRPGIFPNVSTTGNWADVGHYTQMVWRQSGAIGCGVASSRSSDFLVCHYAPKGNIDGRPVI